MSNIYISYIGPFRRIQILVADQIGLPTYDYRIYSFVENGKPMSPDSFYQIFRSTMRLFGQDFGIQAYRQISIAFANKHLIPGFWVDEVHKDRETDALDAQAAHTARTRDQVYALDTSSLPMATSNDLETFYKASQAWQVELYKRFVNLFYSILHDRSKPHIRYQLLQPT